MDRGSKTEIRTPDPSSLAELAEVRGDGERRLRRTTTKSEWPDTGFIGDNSAESLDDTDNTKTNEAVGGRGAGAAANASADREAVKRTATHTTRRAG